MCPICSWMLRIAVFLAICELCRRAPYAVKWRDLRVCPSCAVGMGSKAPHDG